MRIFADFASSSIAAGQSWKSAGVENQRPTLEQIQRSTISKYADVCRLTYYLPAGPPTLVIVGRS